MTSRDLEPEFSKWMLKLTAEKLFSKSDIAMEFAKLERELVQTTEELKQIKRSMHEFGVQAGKMVLDLHNELATAEARAYERAAGVAHEWATKHLVHKEPEYPYHPVDGYYNPAQAAEQIEKAIRALSQAPVDTEKSG